MAFLYVSSTTPKNSQSVHTFELQLYGLTVRYRLHET